MVARFFVINPYSAFGGLTTALHLARAADVTFNAGSWMRPCSIEIPENPEHAAIVRELLVDSKLEFHESPYDNASY